MSDNIINGNAHDMKHFLHKFQKYKLLLSDPPWKQNERNNPDTRYGLGCQYPTMETVDICNMPVKEITHRNCMLFLWTTCPKLPDALQVMSAWGFNFSTVGFAWIKTYPGLWKRFKEFISQIHMFPPTDEQITELLSSINKFGTGFYTASNIELVLIGLKGKAFKHKMGHKASQLVFAPLSPIHSKKPPEIIRRIDWMYNVKPKIEIFARRPPEGWNETGWDRFGNEVL